MLLNELLLIIMQLHIRIGCFTGTFGSDWGDLQGCDKQRAGGLYNVTGNGDFLLSNRISYEYDLKGPRWVFSSIHIKLLAARPEKYMDD